MGQREAIPAQRPFLVAVLVNRRDAPARYLLVCTPAGFERQIARMAAQAHGTEPPPWALQPIPEVVLLGPSILGEVLDRVE